MTEQNINAAIIERLERVVDSLSENSQKMGQLLAVHNEKLDNQDKVDEYRSGKDKLFGFFVGQVMKDSGGKANPQMVNKILKEKLN